jgi:hypothetical protein
MNIYINSITHLCSTRLDSCTFQMYLFPTIFNGICVCILGVFVAPLCSCCICCSTGNPESLVSTLWLILNTGLCELSIYSNYYWYENIISLTTRMSNISVMLLFWQYSVVWCNGTFLCEHRSKMSLLLNYYKKCQQNTLLKTYLLIQGPTFLPTAIIRVHMNTYWNIYRPYNLACYKR